MVEQIFVENSLYIKHEDKCCNFSLRRSANPPWARGGFPILPEEHHGFPTFPEEHNGFPPSFNGLLPVHLSVIQEVNKCRPILHAVWEWFSFCYKSVWYWFAREHPDLISLIGYDRRPRHKNYKYLLQINNTLNIRSQIFSLTSGERYIFREFLNLYAYRFKSYRQNFFLYTLQTEYITSDFLHIVYLP